MNHVTSMFSYHGGPAKLLAVDAGAGPQEGEEGHLLENDVHGFCLRKVANAMTERPAMRDLVFDQFMRRTQRRQARKRQHPAKVARLKFKRRLDSRM